MRGYDIYIYEYSLLNRKGDKMIELDLSKIEDIEFDGIDTNDYPDFCDAFITSATYNGRDLTEEELEWIGDDNSDWVYDKLMEHLY